jgi:hypothetical protein
VIEAESTGLSDGNLDWRITKMKLSLLIFSGIGWTIAGMAADPACADDGSSTAVVDAEVVRLSVGAFETELEFRVIVASNDDEGEGSPASGDPDAVTVRYWGDGEAVTALQQVVWEFDLDATENRNLPFGIAPFSADTVPNRRGPDAVAVMATSEGAVVFFGDVFGVSGIRTTDGLVEAPEHAELVKEDGFADVGVVGCSATVGSCTCEAKGNGAKCIKYSDGAGTDWADCKDGDGGLVKCWAKGGNCGCKETSQALSE